jgi:hypothetical protein
MRYIQLPGLDSLVVQGKDLANLLTRQDGPQEPTDGTTVSIKFHSGNAVSVRTVLYQTAEGGILAVDMDEEGNVVSIELS